MSEIISTKFGNARLDKKGHYQITSRKEGNNRKYLHRLIFEEFYQCDLNEMFPEGVIIHHDDGNPLNNEIWNLVPMSNAEHTRLHSLGRNHSQQSINKMRQSKKNVKHSINSTVKMSKIHNTSGYFRVSKRVNKRYKKGFYYVYQYYDKNNKRHSLTSANIKDLEKKVKDLDLPWFKLEEFFNNEEYLEKLKAQQEHL